MRLFLSPKSINILERLKSQCGLFFYKFHAYKLIYHGQIDGNRGLIDLVDAFNSLSNQYNQLELKIIGPIRKKGVKEIIENRSNKKMKLMEPIPHSDIWGMLSNSHIGIIPFHDMPMFRKNTPTKLFELMATNCGVVASKLEPIYEFASDSISFSEPENINSLIHAIEFYLTNVEIYKKHISHNRELIQKRYNWDLESQKLLNLYEGLIS